MKYIMMGTSSNFGNMFSMAGATLLLPFLPMLPVQILLNNLLYDVSELALPFDRVDEQVLERPCTWDVGFVQRFMLSLGPVSSFFDFLMFYLLYWYFGSGPELFHTGWFVESIATQVLVIFVIRTRGKFFASRPNPWLVALAFAVVAFAAVLPALPIAAPLGFVPLPGAMFVAIGVIVAVYLVTMEAAKERFYRYRDARARR
jgi:Mg2+-importing ATPase